MLPEQNVPQATPEQIDVAQQRAAQRLQTQHAVLKLKFADVSVDLEIARKERDEVIQRLQAAQQVIEKLTEDKKQPAATADKDEKAQENS